MQDVVFDVSHHQGTVDFACAKAAGMQAVIVKASEGIESVDPKFGDNAVAAGQAGLLIGAYHFGNDNDGMTQADHFLATATASCLRVLDFEHNPSQMTVGQAEVFVQRVFDVKGIWPVVYADSGHAQQLATSLIIPANCPLWLATYRSLSNPPAPPLGWLNGYRLWQYSDHGQIAGLPQFFDRSAFMGDDITSWWNSQVC